MHPRALVQAAVGAGLGAVAVCDHNSARNVAATMRAAAGTSLAVIAGMEVTSAEEVHLVALLPDAPAALRLQARVYQSLPGVNDDEAFGMQVVVDEHGEVLAFDQHLLIGATTWPIERAVDEIRREGGLVVAAHVDREGFGIIGQLGMIPPALALDALEISRHADLAAARRRYAPAGEPPVVCASDAHEPGDVGRAVTFMLLAEPTVAEIGLALAGREGRAVLGGGRAMEDLSLHILDIAQNSVEAGARSIAIEVREDLGADSLVIEVRDDGRGMDAEAVARARDPFFTTRTTRKVGMGLGLLEEAARAAGGGLALESTPGQGTRVTATFRHGHIDRAPLGDLETTLVVLLVGHPGVRLVFEHAVGDQCFALDSRDLAEVLAGEPFSSPAGLALLRAAIRQGEGALAT